MKNKTVVSVTDFGAVANTDKFQDEYIQKAIDHCFLEGGGEVLIPCGKYRTRGIRLRSNVTLHLLEDAVLEASRDPEDYFILKNDKVEPVDPSELCENGWERFNGAFREYHIYGSRWHNAVIRIYKSENVKVIGEKGSVIDGCNSYDPKGEEYYRGVHGISVHNSENVTLKGYTVQNTGNWAHNIMNTKNFRIEDVTCLAGHDGVHMTTCEDIEVINCRFFTGDDCVAGFNNKNVLVYGCEINSACSAFRFSGSNVLVTDCNIYAPAKHMFRGGMTKEEKESGMMANDAPSSAQAKRNNMLSVFTYYADFSVEIVNLGTNIVFRNCEIDGADRFLHFNYSGNETWQNNKPLLGIKFENITAKNISMPLTAYGDKESPVTVEFENVDFSMREGKEDITFMHTANFKEIKLKNVNIENSSAPQLIKCWSKQGEGKFTFENVTCDIPKEKLVLYTEEPFICQPI